MSAVPNPPSSVQCLNITNGSLVLAIEKPSSGSVHHYNVIVKITDPQLRQQPLSHNESTVNMRFHNLRPYYNYEFEVTSALDQRHNKESTKYHNKCRTAEGSKQQLITVFLFYVVFFSTGEMTKFLFDLLWKSNAFSTGNSIRGVVQKRSCLHDCHMANSCWNFCMFILCFKTVACKKYNEIL